MSKEFPCVTGEAKTISAVLAGKNLSRSGDGECKAAYGFGYSREPPNIKLALELRHLFSHPDPNCLVGIPTFDPKGPKYENWMRHQARFRGLINFRIKYYSAFVSRPDSAPWINTPKYGKLVQSLWLDKRAAVICERKGSMFETVKMGAASVKHIECPHERAYDVIDELERAACVADADIVIMSAGPTATCLANRLARRGVHAVDLGSAGRFIRRLLEA